MGVFCLNSVRLFASLILVICHVIFLITTCSSMFSVGFCNAWLPCASSLVIWSPGGVWTFAACLASLSVSLVFDWSLFCMLVLGVLLAVSYVFVLFLSASMSEMLAGCVVECVFQVAVWEIFSFHLLSWHHVISLSLPQSLWCHPRRVFGLPLWWYLGSYFSAVSVLARLLLWGSSGFPLLW